MAHNNSKFKLEAVRAESRARPRPSGNAERREQGEDLRARGARQSGENGMKFCAGQDVSWGIRPTHGIFCGWKIAGPENRLWRWRGMKGAAGPSLHCKHSYFVIFCADVYICILFVSICVY